MRFAPHLLLLGLALSAACGANKRPVYATANEVKNKRAELALRFAR